MKPLDPASTGFDFDGVIADTIEAFLRIACEQYNRCDVRPEDFTGFDLGPLARETADAIFDYLTREPLAAGIQPMPGAVQTLKRICRTSPLTIVTARPEARPVELWLAHYFGAASRRFHIIAVGDHDDKMRHIRAAGLSAFIDDRAETCVALAEAGIDVRVFSHPWNQGRHHLPALRNWQEIDQLFAGDTTTP